MTGQHKRCSQKLLLLRIIRILFFHNFSVHQECIYYMCPNQHEKKEKNLNLALIVTIFFLVAAVVSARWVKFQKERPLCPWCNIVLIDIDILRADALPCYGYKRNTAPNICALAQKGLVFTDNYAQSTWTLPEHDVNHHVPIPIQSWCFKNIPGRP